MSRDQKQPLLSICVPTRNRVDLLERTLRSLMTEAHDVEIIVTDNSEGNDTKHAVEQLFEGYTGVWRYHKNNFPHDMSGLDKMVGNFNMGVQLARGRYIFILHDDDYLLKGALDILLRGLRTMDEAYKIIIFGTQLVDLECNVLRVDHFADPGYYSPTESLEKLLQNSSSVHSPGFLFRKEVYDTVGLWDVEGCPPVDYNMWVRSFSEFGVYVMPDVLSAFTIHPASVTMTMFNVESIRALIDDFEFVRKKNLLQPSRLEALKSEFIHQFILAGVWKFIKKGECDEARQVMHLSKLPEIRQLRVSPKWYPVKMAFSLYISLSKMLPSVLASRKIN